MKSLDIHKIVTLLTIVLCSSLHTVAIVTHYSGKSPLIYLEDISGHAEIMLTETIDSIISNKEHGQQIIWSKKVIGYYSNENGEYEEIYEPRIIHSIDLRLVSRMEYFTPFTTDIKSISAENSPWDKIYLTPYGFFAVAEHYKLCNDEVRMVSYMSFDGYVTKLIISREHNMPLALINDDYEINFSYTDADFDVAKDEYYDFEAEHFWIYPYIRIEGIVTPKNGMILQIGKYLSYDFDPGKANQENSQFEEALSHANQAMTYKANNPLAPQLYDVVLMLSSVDLSSYNPTTQILDAFYGVLNIKQSEVFDADDLFPIAAAGTSSSIIGGMLNGESNNGTHNTNFSIVVTTGGTENVFANSCTALGSVKCASSLFRSRGKYGILCDKKPNNLKIGSAQFDVPGFQEPLKLSFKSQISGLEQNTTYYYRAYYKLNSAKDQDLFIKFDNEDPNKISDKVADRTYGKIESFTTDIDLTGTWHLTSKVFSETTLHIDVERGTDKYGGPYIATNSFFGVFSLNIKVNRDRSFTLLIYSPNSSISFSGRFNEDFTVGSGWVDHGGSISRFSFTK